MMNEPERAYGELPKYSQNITRNDSRDVLNQIRKNESQCSFQYDPLDLLHGTQMQMVSSQQHFYRPGTKQGRRIKIDNRDTLKACGSHLKIEIASQSRQDRRQRNQ